MLCSCGPNEACSECPKVDDLSRARGVILARLAAHGDKLPADHVRNLATAYGILTDKWMNEHHVTSYTGADGNQYAHDGLGRPVPLASV